MLSRNCTGGLPERRAHTPPSLDIDCSPLAVADRLVLGLTNGMMPSLQTTVSEVCGPEHVVLGLTYLSSEWVAALLFLAMWFLVAWFNHLQYRCRNLRAIRTKHHGPIIARNMGGEQAPWKEISTHHLSSSQRRRDKKCGRLVSACAVAGSLLAC